jgi:OHCU decarboxylase
MAWRARTGSKPLSIIRESAKEKPNASNPLKRKRGRAGEQAAAESAPIDAKAALIEANRAYEEKFEYIFIVCASGKTTDEILVLLKERLANDPAAELPAAAEEQRKITRLRLEKLLAK